jgi:hypothetical protein
MSCGPFAVKKEKFIFQHLALALLTARSWQLTASSKRGICPQSAFFFLHQKLCS